MEKKLEDIKLGFLPLPLFVILAVILVVAELTGKMTVTFIPVHWYVHYLAVP